MNNSEKFKNLILHAFLIFSDFQKNCPSREILIVQIIIFF